MPKPRRVHSVVPEYRMARGAVLSSGCMLAALLLSGCGGIQSSLAPQGSGAGAIYGVWHLFFWTCAAVFLVVVVGLLGAMLRGRHLPADASPQMLPEPARERRLDRLLQVGVGAPRSEGHKSEL